MEQFTTEEMNLLVDGIKVDKEYIAKQQARIDALVTALDMMKDRYMAVQYPMMWLHDVVKIDPEVEQADRLTNKYKHKGE